MLNGKKIAVVVPAYNEAKQIKSVIETMPKFVDRIIVVDDASTDKTSEVVKQIIDQAKPSENLIKNIYREIIQSKYNRAEVVEEEMKKIEAKRFVESEMYNKKDARSRIILIRHTKNSSVGAAIATGYRWCRDHGIDCTAVMAGDGQMDPDELERICKPVVEDNVDYVKGNRLSHRSAFFVVPKIRYFGNSILTLLTKIASGYWRVSDTQTGFTAIHLNALSAIRIHDIYKSYGCPNDILVKLNIAFCTIKEVPIKPIYQVGEKSKMKIFKVMPKISWLLFKLFWKRLYVKYLFRDFHPLFLLYHLGFSLLIVNIPFAVDVLKAFPLDSPLDIQTLLIFMFLSISGFQALFFAMWMDMMDNDRLQK